MSTTFGPFLLVSERGELLRDGKRLPIGHRGFMLLEHLLRHRGKAISKSDLIDAAWPDTVVEENNLAVQIKALREMLGDTPDGGPWITTIARVGYRLAGSPSFEAAPRASVVEATRRVSLGISAFESTSSNPDDEAFARGLVDDLVTALRKVRNIAVAAPDELRRQDRMRGSKAERLFGLDYILSGTLRSHSGRIRLNLTLRGSNGDVRWTDRYDGELANIFTAQNEITSRIVTELQVALTEGEQARLGYQPTSNFEAWTHWARAQQEGAKPVSPHSLAAVRHHLLDALRLDPGSAALNAEVALAHFAMARMLVNENRETDLAQCRAAIDRALLLEPENPHATIVLAEWLLTQRRFEEAIETARGAILHGPTSSRVAAFASWVFCCAGNAAEGLAEIERGLQLSPIYPVNHTGHLSNALRLLGRYDEAAAVLYALGRVHPNQGLVDLVIVEHLRGNHAAAKVAAEALATARPEFTIARWRQTQFRRDALALDEDVAALRMAGLPAD